MSAAERDILPVRDAFVDADGDRVPDRKGQVVSIAGVLIADPVPVFGEAALANLQDETGGVVLFTRKRDLLYGRVQRGDRVVATGEVTLYRGTRQLLLRDVGRIDRGTIPPPRGMPISELLAQGPTAELLRLSGNLDVPPGFLTRKEPTVLRDASGEIEVLVPDRIFSEPAFLARFQKGGGVALTGLAVQASEKQGGKLRILPRDAADFQFAPIPPYWEIAIATGFVVLATIAWWAIARRGRADRRARQARAEAELAMAERDRFFGLSLDLLCIASSNGYLRRVNPAFTRTLGWTAEELLARPLLDFVCPDDHATANEQFAKLRDGIEVSCYENRWRCKDGTMRVLSWKGVQRPDGTIYASARDVTEQRAAEAALRALNTDLEHRVVARTEEVREALATLDATEDAACIFDAATLRFSYVNEGAVRQLRYSREELLGMSPWQIMPEFGEARLRDLLAPMTRGDGGSHVLTTQHRRKDGREIPVEIKLQYVALTGARPRFVSIVRDITERRRTERLAFRSQRLESLGTLAGGVAHDLNNALTPLMMGLSSLREQYPRDTHLIDTRPSAAPTWCGSC